MSTEKNTNDGVPVITPSDPSAVAVRSVAEDSDQGLQAPHAPAHKPDFRHKDLWSARTQHFTVEVSRHTEEPSEFSDRREGGNRWAVYAYIYPTYPLFALMKSEGEARRMAADMPLHGGCTYVQHYVNARLEMTSVQVGADYHHLYDEQFTHDATREEAREQFRDAGHLFEWLEARASAVYAEGNTPPE